MPPGLCMTGCRLTGAGFNRQTRKAGGPRCANVPSNGSVRSVVSCRKEIKKAQKKKVLSGSGNASRSCRRVAGRVSGWLRCCGCQRVGGRRPVHVCRRRCRRRWRWWLWLCRMLCRCLSVLRCSLWLRRWRGWCIRLLCLLLWGRPWLSLLLLRPLSLRLLLLARWRLACLLRRLPCCWLCCVRRLCRHCCIRWQAVPLLRCWGGCC